MDWQTIVAIIGTTTAPIITMLIFVLNRMSRIEDKVDRNNKEISDKVGQNGKAISRLEGYIAGAEHSHAETVKKSRAGG